MNHPHLSQSDILTLKERMEQDLSTVLERMKELESQDPFTDPEHANDNAANDKEASEEEGHDRINAQVEELMAQKTALEKALAKIADGNYGICEVTGLPIPKERLFVFPTATTVVMPDA